MQDDVQKIEQELEEDKKSISELVSLHERAQGEVDENFIASMQVLEKEMVDAKKELEEEVGGTL